MSLKRTPKRPVGHVLKRMLDLAVGIVSLALLALPFALIAVIIKLDSDGPVFFRQERIGLRGKPFRVWKFRTMVDGASGRGLGLTVTKADARITRVGNVLRNWGIDELPQLINVLEGSMSLVGPRPTLAYQVAAYDEYQRRRLQMKPGITGLAVVSGRNALSWNERIRLDVQYVDDWSFWLDLKLLLKTLWVVLVMRSGVYGEDGGNDPFVEPPATHEGTKGANG